MERQELLTKSEVFEDEILAGTQRTDSPSKEVPEQHDHGKNLTEICIVGLTAKSLILTCAQCFDEAQPFTNGTW